MPVPKLVWQGNGGADGTGREPDWAPAKATWNTCEHPRDRLRWDGSLATPSYMYCRDCGLRWISPYTGKHMKP